MTNNKKAIKILRKRQRFCKVIAEYANETVKADELREVEALDMAIPPSAPSAQEWVEKVWRGKWHRHYKSGIHAGNGVVCSKCDMWNNRAAHFCPSCGALMKEDEHEAG